MGDALDLVLDAYIRVSRVGGREGPGYISPSVQRDAISRWAQYKGITIAEWHVDEDWSGGTHNRPGLDAAITRALAGETRGIVSWKIDRFSRHTEGGLRDLRRLEARNARLAFVVEDIDTGTVYGRMVYTILLAVSEAFLESIKQSWVVAKERAVARGAYISRTPWGYQRNDDGTLSPHPVRGPIVAEAFRLAAGGSLHAAQDYLDTVAPERSWTATKLRRLLSQRSYLGETRNGATVAAGTHEPLVSRAIWEAAQTVPKAKRRTKASFPLSGLPTCGSCGNPLAGGRGGKQQRAYRCVAGMSQWRGQPCPRPVLILADRLEEYVIAQARPIADQLQAAVSDTGDSQAALLEGALVEAEAELDAFAGDLTMRRVLGDRYHEHLAARSEAVTQARQAFTAHTQGRIRTSDIEGDLLDLSRPGVVSAMLRGIFASIVVKPGRGMSVEQRVVLYPADLDDPSGVFGA